MKLLVVLSIAMMAGLAAANYCHLRQYQCELTPEAVEGPYFIEDIPQRSNISEDRQGIPFGIDFVFMSTANCAHIKGLIVHLWLADAIGEYSGFIDFNEGEPGGPGGPPGGGGGERNTPTDDYRFLRGYQITDDNGQVHFDLVVPGWYQGRCLHMHIETMLPPELGGTNNTIHTTQVYFPEGFADMLRSYAPYNTNTNEITTNARDGIYGTNGNRTLLNMQQVSANVMDGYRTSITLGVNVNVDNDDDDDDDDDDSPNGSPIKSMSPILLPILLLVGLLR